MRVAGAAAFAAVGLLACSSGRPSTPSTPPAPLGTEFELAAGASTVVGGQGLRVAFEAVEADSRCPMDVQCVWEGDAVARLVLSQPGQSPSAARLHTAGSQERSALYGPYLVELVGLVPQPRSGAPIAPGDYRVRLRVTAR